MTNLSNGQISILHYWNNDCTINSFYPLSTVKIQHKKKLKETNSLKHQGDNDCPHVISRAIVQYIRRE